jgi:hypothetical protein
MADDEVDVGEALTGVRGKSWWRKQVARHAGDVEDQRGEEWPSWSPGRTETQPGPAFLPQSSPPRDILDFLDWKARLNNPDTLTPMGKATGIEELHRPTPEEMQQYYMHIDYLNSEPGRRETEELNPWLPDTERRVGLQQAQQMMQEAEAAKTLPPDPRFGEHVPLPRPRPTRRR